MMLVIGGLVMGRRGGCRACGGFIGMGGSRRGRRGGGRMEFVKTGKSDAEMGDSDEAGSGQIADGY